MKGDSPEKVVRSVVQDPETQAWTFAAQGPDGETMGIGASHGSESSYESLCAAVLIQFTDASERGKKEFIKAVIEEFNNRQSITDSMTAPHGGRGNE